MFVTLSEEMPEAIDETAEQISKEVDKVSNNVAYWLNYAKSRIPGVITYILMVIVALVIFFIGKKIIKLLIKIIKKSFNRTNLDEGVSRFLASVINIILHILLIILIAGFLGLETTSLAALVGSAGLAIGLSLQGSLANFAGGVLILILKPFTLNDYIVAEGVEGTVTHIDIFYTRILTVDNKLVVIPNGKLSNAVITNVTNEPVRMIEFSIGIRYEEDIDRVRDILKKLADDNSMVLNDRKADIFVDSFGASAVMIGFRIWVEKENYWRVKWDMQENIKKEFDKCGISIPFDQLDVNIHSND